MSWFDEARQSLHASWLLLLRDGTAYRLFNATEAGFWRSFSAIVLVAPLYLYAAALEARLPGVEQAPTPVAWPLLGLMLQWAGWPLLMAGIAHAAGLSRHYARYIIAYNWSSVIVIAAFLPPLLFYDFGVAGAGLTAVLTLFVILASLYYRWYIAVTALEASGIVGLALVLADLVLSIAVNRLTG